jgi:chemotaxis protein MotB
LQQTQQRLQEQGLDLRREPRGLIISLPQAVLFASGDDRINPLAFPMVSQIAAVLRDIQNKVTLVGHADAIPIHNQHFKSNWELSAARSLNLLSLLATQYGIDESRLSVQSFGSYSPRDSNETESGRAENRRVEILILNESPHEPNPQ